MSNGRRIPLWGWLALIDGILILTLIVLLFPFTRQWLRSTGDYNKYLLSAEAQVLGALFALVFTAILIATQFVTKYTHRTMRILFRDKEVLLYLGGLAISVLIPLWCLSAPTSLCTFIALAYGSGILILLIPFFLDLGKIMNIERIIVCLKEEGLNALPEAPEKANENINALDNIAMGAYTDRNFEVFELAEGALANSLLGIEKKLKKLETGTPGRKLFDDIVDRLRDACRDPEVIDNPRAPRIIIENLGRVGAEAIEYNKDRIVNYFPTEDAARNTIVVIENLCDRDTRIRLSIYCYVALNNMLKATKNILGQDHLIGKLIDIFDHHLDKEWKDWLPNFLDATLDLMKEYPIGTPELWTRLVNHFFSYFAFFAKHDMFDMAKDNYRQILNLIDFLKETKIYHFEYTTPVMVELGNYAKKCLNKNEEWREKVAERIYLKLASLTDTFIKQGPFILIPLTQKDYFYAIGTNRLTGEKIRILFEKIFKQIEQIGKIEVTDVARLLDADWSSNLAHALKEGGKRLRNEYGIDFIQRHWSSIKESSGWIIRLSFKEGKDWPNLLAALHLFFYESMALARSTGTLPVPFQEELFKWTWITFVTFKTGDFRYNLLAHYLLNNKEFAKDFFDQYYRAAKEEGMKLGISGDTFEERRGFLAAISQYNLPQSS